MQMQMRVEATSNCQLPHDSSSKCSCRSDRERERNCSILFCTVRFAYEVLSVVMIEILATVLCVRSSNSSFLYPRPQPLGSSLCMSLSPTSISSRTIAGNSTQLDSQLNYGLASSWAMRLVQGVWLCLLAHCSTIHLKAGHVQLQLQLFTAAALLPLLCL